MILPVYDSMKCKNLLVYEITLPFHLSPSYDWHIRQPICVLHSN